MVIDLEKELMSVLSTANIISRLTYRGDCVGVRLYYSDLSSEQKRNKIIAYACVIAEGTNTEYCYGPSLFKKLPESLQKDPDFVLQCVKKRPELYFQLSETLQENPDIAKYAPKEKQDDSEIKPE
ncbi:MAG: DUF4116 domain-containing protein [Clostridiales bacterium]|nr:DUF4116 domain-containing protein [Clostridiales bacterium]